MEIRLMMKLIIGTESMFFLSLMMAYIYFSVHTGIRFTESANLNLPRAAYFTAFLFASSLTFWRAEINARQSKITAVKYWLLATIILGSVFIYGQVHEYSTLLRSQVTVSSSIFGTSFFTLTGFHGLHVIIGIVILSILTILISAKGAPTVSSSVLSAIGIYWHFVDVVWLVLFAIVYVSPPFKDSLMNDLMFKWHVDPFEFILMVSFVCMFFYIRRSAKGNSSFFWAGLILFFIATSSPIHFLAMTYYFSAHMICHILILLLSGPLMVAGLAKPVHKRQNIFVNRISCMFHKRPWLSWLAGVFIMWLWHIPAIFNASKCEMNFPISIMPVLQTGSLLIAGMIFSWPLFGPIKEYRIHPLSGIVYLFTACISCSLLGLLITFAPTGVYLNPIGNMAGMLSLKNPWHLTQVEDEQAAGLIMWVPCCLLYLSGCFILLAQWFNEKKSNPYRSSTYLIN